LSTIPTFVFIFQCWDNYFWTLLETCP